MKNMNLAKTKMNLVFDIETDDLKATKVHCIVAQDVDTKEFYKFPPNKLEEGYNFLQSADKLIGHNIIGFDIPMVEKFSDVKLTHKVVDTLVLSRLFNPIREGGHSLESWGYRLNLPKIKFEDYFSEIGQPFYDILKKLIPVWNETVWNEDLPIKLRRQKVIDMNFKDFIGLPKDLKDRKYDGPIKFTLPIRRPKKSSRDLHPLKK